MREFFQDPGHRWLLALAPLYALAELLPATRADARRCELVTIRPMVRAFVSAVENPPPSWTVRALEAPAFRAARIQESIVA